MPSRPTAPQAATQPPARLHTLGHESLTGPQGARPVSPEVGAGAHVLNDADGVSHVPVAGAGYARIGTDALERLRAAGLSLAWFAVADDQGNLQVRAPSKNPQRHPVLTVARLLTGAAPYERVRFRNGDRLDLRRENLKTEGRTSRAVLLGVQR